MANKALNTTINSDMGYENGPQQTIDVSSKMDQFTN